MVTHLHSWQTTKLQFQFCWLVCEMNTFEFSEKEIRLNLFKFEQAVKKAVWRGRVELKQCTIRLLFCGPYCLIYIFIGRKLAYILTTPLFLAAQLKVWILIGESTSSPLLVIKTILWDQPLTLRTPFTIGYFLPKPSLWLKCGNKE